MLRPRREIENLSSGVHGGLDYKELEGWGISPQNIMDFSVSTNPYGPPGGIRRAIKQSVISDYPDSAATELKKTLAKKTRVPPENLLVGNGSTELIRLITTAYLTDEHSVILPQPTYGEYELASRIAGAKAIKQTLSPESAFKMDTGETVSLINKHRPKAVFICNPNNPTGQYLSKAEITNIVRASRDTLIVLDEAYIAFTENPWSSTDLIKAGNVIILRSMTKDYALAGLRLGYMIAPESIISVLDKVKPPWNVSSIAQGAGIFVLEKAGYLEECRRKINISKEYLFTEFRGLGLNPLPSRTNFFMIRVGNARRFREKLLRKEILVRDCTSFGFPDYIRLAPRSMADCRRLIKAIKEIGGLS